MAIRRSAQQQLDASWALASVASGPLAVLRAAFRQAEADGAPPRLRASIRFDNARQGFVEPDQAERIFAELDRPFSDAARFSYLAARRINEVLTLRWAQIDRDAREVRWAKLKNGRPLTPPLTGGLWEPIERPWAARRIGAWLSPSVFSPSHRGPLSYSAYRVRFVDAAVRAGLPHIRPHDLRRSGVRNLIRSGVSQSVAKTISGHVSDAMFQRYDITSTDDQRADRGAAKCGHCEEQFGGVLIGEYVTASAKHTSGSTTLATCARSSGCSSWLFSSRRARRPPPPSASSWLSATA